MIVRYGKNQKGKTVKLAVIYTKEEHGIGREKFDFDAVSICEKLRYAGYKSYIVGGAVRDLLLNNSPKDFDIVTDAVPSAIKKIFRRSRIIGKRFRLVHVYQGKNIYEVATFRSGGSESHNNSFGTMAEDVWRRDFTINSLYFCPFDEQIIDFTGGYKDLAKRLVKPVIPLKTIFLEDPVRIIRAVKYSVMIGGDLPFFLKMRIKRHARELLLCSPSRITEEALKIMKTEYSADIFRRLASLGILKLVLPGVYEMQKNSSFYKRIEIFDNLKKAGKISTESLSAVLQPLIEDFIIGIHTIGSEPLMTMKEIVDDVKIFLRPITPPNRDIADAVKLIVRQNRIKVKPSLPYHFRPKH
ncbi:MAG: polynucleotide adenylyltransferase PcnB [Spirochaetales bacterium]|nr:polynucleotide adenylyltransferase PcnB [Spirochaetales bacterium]